MKSISRSIHQLSREFCQVWSFTPTGGNRKIVREPMVIGRNLLLVAVVIAWISGDKSCRSGDRA